MGVAGLYHGGLHKPAFRLVALATQHNLGVGGLLGIVDIRLALVERGFIDDGVHKVSRVFHIAHGDF